MFFIINFIILIGHLLPTLLLIFTFTGKNRFMSFIFSFFSLSFLFSFFLYPVARMDTTPMIILFVLIPCELFLCIKINDNRFPSRSAKQRFVSCLASISLFTCFTINSCYLTHYKSDFPVFFQKIQQIYEVIDTDPLPISGFTVSEETTEEVPETFYGEEWTISNNIDTILLLQESEWDKLSIKQRKDVLNVVLSIEGRYLELFNKINLEFKELEENVEGSYSHSSSTIYISSQLLEYGTAHDNLDTLCHEVFHSAEHQLVEIYQSLPESERNSCNYSELAETYIYEFSNYTRGVNDFNTYYQQRIEADARDYASASVNDYYRRIKEYLDS